jgi:DNA repair ATPase RecN
MLVARVERMDTVLHQHLADDRERSDRLLLMVEQVIASQAYLGQLVHAVEAVTDELARVAVEVKEVRQQSRDTLRRIDSQGLKVEQHDVRLCELESRVERHSRKLIEFGQRVTRIEGTEARVYRQKSSRLLLATMLTMLLFLSFLAWQVWRVDTRINQWEAAGAQ